MSESRQYTDEELRVLARVLQFSGDPGELRKVLPSLTMQVYAAGETVISEGEIGTDVFVLVKGSVAVKRVKWLVFSTEIARLSAGDFFGEIGFLVPTARSASVEAASPCEAFRLVSDDLKSLLDRYPGLREKLEESARERLFALARQA